MILLKKKRLLLLARLGFLFTTGLTIAIFSFAQFGWFKAPNVYAANTPDMYFTFDSATGTITDYDEVNGPSDVVIPSQIGGVDVVAISDASYDEVGDSYSGAFARNNLTSVELPATLESIGSIAFAENDLASITIPNNVTNIGPAAFTLNSLTTVVIGDGVTSLNYGAFSHNLIDSLVIGDSVTLISMGAFAYNNITSIDFPDSVTEISRGAFQYNDLSSIEVPDSVERIFGAPFNQNEHLTTVKIGTAGYTDEPHMDISQGAFSGSDPDNKGPITTVELGGSVRSITEGSFAYNQIASLMIHEGLQTADRGSFEYNELTDVALPNSLISIGPAFRYNPLESVTIGTSNYGGASHTTILGGAFSLIESAYTVTLHKSVRTVDAGAFSQGKVTAVTIAEGAAESIGAAAFAENQIGELTIASDSVKTIGPGAFSENQLTELILPEGVEELQNGAFDTNPLETVMLPNSLQVLAPAFNGVHLKVISIGTEDYTGPSHITIPTGTFGNSVYDEDFNLIEDMYTQTVHLGKSVQTVGPGAFAGLRIKDLTIDEGAAETIQTGAFAGNEITHLNIAPNSVKEIGEGAFDYNDLTTVVIPEGVESILNGAFDHNPIEQLTLPNSLQTLYNAFGNNLHYKSITIGTGDYTGGAHLDLPQGAFANGLTDEDSNIIQPLYTQTVYIGPVVRSIGVGAFAELRTTSLTIAEGAAETIDSGAFESSDLSTLSIPHSVKTIRYGAFADNDLTQITLSDGIETVNSGAFDNNQLSSVTIPNSVKILEPAFANNPLQSVMLGSSGFSGTPEMEVAEGAFSSVTSTGSYNINQLAIKRSVASIGNGAFSYNNLKNVSVEGAPTVGEGVFSYNGLDRTVIPDAVDQNLYYQNNAELVRVYASDPTWNFQPEYYYSDQGGFYEGPIVSGVIVNPAQYNVTYQTDDGQPLGSQTQVVGEGLSDYKLINTIANPSSSTPSLIFSPYYTVGTPVSPGVLDFSGYIAPTSQTVTLGSLNNYTSNIVYVYQAPKHDALVTGPVTSTPKDPPLITRIITFITEPFVPEVVPPVEEEPTVPARVVKEEEGAAPEITPQPLTSKKNVPVSPALVITPTVAVFFMAVFLVREIAKEFSRAHHLRNEIKRRKELSASKSRFLSMVVGSLNGIVETLSTALGQLSSAQLSVVLNRLTATGVALEQATVRENEYALSTMLAEKAGKKVYHSFFFWLPVALSVIFTAILIALYVAVWSGNAPSVGIVTVYVIVIAVVLVGVFIARTLYIAREDDTIATELVNYSAHLFEHKKAAVSIAQRELTTQRLYLRDFASMLDTYHSQAATQAVNQLTSLEIQLNILLSLSEPEGQNIQSVRSIIDEELELYGPSLSQCQMTPRATIDSAGVGHSRQLTYIFHSILGRVIALGAPGSDVTISAKKKASTLTLTVSVPKGVNPFADQAVLTTTLIELATAEIGTVLKSAVSADQLLMYELVIPITNAPAESRTPLRPSAVGGAYFA